LFCAAHSSFCLFPFVFSLPFLFFIRSGLTFALSSN
jgi:hypothetical protein